MPPRPRLSPTAITVGATTRTDARAELLQLRLLRRPLCPGRRASPRRWNSTTARTNTISGTSMATPHVAGAAAATPDQPEVDAAAGPRPDRHQRCRRRGTRPRPGQPTGCSTSQHLPGRALRTACGLAPTASSLCRRRGQQAPGRRRRPSRAWEKYDIVDAGSGLVALRAKVNGKYVSATRRGHQASGGRGSVGQHLGEFQLINNTDGSVSLKAKVNGKYVSHRAGAALTASAASISTWEKFSVDAPAPVVSIKLGARVEVRLREWCRPGPAVPDCHLGQHVGRSSRSSTWRTGSSASARLSTSTSRRSGAGSSPMRATVRRSAPGRSLDFLDYNANDRSTCAPTSTGRRSVLAVSGLASADPQDDRLATRPGLGVGEQFVVDPAYLVATPRRPPAPLLRERCRRAPAGCAG